jgi:hypothetical protein
MISSGKLNQVANYRTKQEQMQAKNNAGAGAPAPMRASGLEGGLTSGAPVATTAENPHLADKHDAWITIYG